MPIVFTIMESVSFSVKHLDCMIVFCRWRTIIYFGCQASIYNYEEVDRAFDMTDSKQYQLEPVIEF